MTKERTNADRPNADRPNADRPNPDRPNVGEGDPSSASVSPTQTEGLDPGAFVGHEPERLAETIPGGIDTHDQRISAVDTQPTGAGRPDRRGQPEEMPGGHREGTQAGDAQVRQAGDSPE
jgi:hypothetical protein